MFVVPTIIDITAEDRSELLEGIERASNRAERVESLGELRKNRKPASTRSHRLAIVAASAGELSAKLEQGHRQLTTRHVVSEVLGDGIYYACGSSAGRIAFMFPGQGSQHLGSIGSSKMFTSRKP